MCSTPRKSAGAWYSPLSAITRCARMVSRLISASIESTTDFSASPPISATLRLMSRSSFSNAVTMWLDMISNLSRSVEAAGDVIERAVVFGIGEHIRGRAGLDQVAEIHEGGHIGDARGLLHVVGHDHDREVTLQFVDQFLDFR